MFLYALQPSLCIMLEIVDLNTPVSPATDLKTPFFLFTISALILAVLFLLPLPHLCFMHDPVSFKLS